MELFFFLLDVIILLDRSNALNNSIHPTPSPTTLPINIIHSWTKNDLNVIQRYYNFAGFDGINNRIFLIGGIFVENKNNDQIPIISFDVESGNVTYYNGLINASDIIRVSSQTIFPAFYSITQGYAVLNNVIYMLLSGSGLICSFNMTDLTMKLHDHKSTLYLGNNSIYMLNRNSSGLMMSSICSDNNRFIAIIGGIQIFSNDNDYGFRLTNNDDTRNKAVIYDTFIDDWISLNNLNKPRIGHACWVYNNKYIYVFGGSTTVPTINDTWFTSSIDTDPTTSIKEINQHVSIGGDRTIEKLIYNNNIDDINSKEWNIIESEMCIGRRGHKVTQILNDNTIYIIGGHFGGRIVEVLLPEINDIMITSSALNEFQRVSHSVVSSNDQIYVFGTSIYI